MNVYNVGPGQTYSTVEAAIADINLRVPAPSALDRVVVAVWPGFYDSTAFGTIDVPAYTSVVAVFPDAHDATVLTNDTAPLFRCVGPYTGFGGFTLYLPAATDQYAILGNDQSNIRIERLKAWSTGPTKQGRFFKQTGATWKNLAIADTVVNALTTTSGGLASEEGIVFLENTSASVRWVDAWFQGRNFWDCHSFTAQGNVLAVYKCDDVRVSQAELRAMGTTGRAALVTSQARVRFNHCHLEGKSAAVYTGSGGGNSTTELEQCDCRGRFGATLAGAGTVINHDSYL
jgi:hypothetical protein